LRRLCICLLATAALAAPATATAAPPPIKHVWVGYPGDKPSGTMWRGNGNVAIDTGIRFGYDADSAPGQSGAPVFRRGVVGIHTEGDPVQSYTGNSAVKIRPSVVADLRRGINTR
jgi:V8-like Glu-specific endopeptidase